MGMPAIYRKQGEGALASYDYLDYASGVGYKKYYLCGADTSAGDIYFLTNLPIASDTYVMSTVGTCDIDFDLNFVNPAIIGGECWINYTMITGGPGTNGIFQFNIYHVRAGAETLLGTITDGTTTGTNTNRKCVKFTISKKAIAIGDILRVNVIVTRTLGAAGPTWYYDPSSRQTFTETSTGSTLPSDCVIYMPFKIDL